MMNSEKVDSKYYEAIKSISVSEKLLILARNTMYNDFIRLCNPSAEDMVLDFGVSDVLENGANYLEMTYPYTQNITAVGLGDAVDFIQSFPEIKYHKILPNEPLPFKDKSFDFVLCNAVLEHVGGYDNQIKLVHELLRIGQNLYITVPNRYFPIEHHTGVPFFHWSDELFALACKLINKSHWASENNLSFLCKKKLSRIFPENLQVDIDYTGIKLGVLSSNIYAHVRA